MSKNTLPWLAQYTLTPDIVDESRASEDPGFTYLGFRDSKPVSETPLDNPYWQIRRVSVHNGITTTEFAEGSMEFDKVWSERSTYNYSFAR